jgi:hypothetical protein
MNTVVMEKNDNNCGNAEQLNVCYDDHGNRLAMIMIAC